MKQSAAQIIFFSLLASMLLVMPVRGALLLCNLNCQTPIETSTSVDAIDWCDAKTSPCHAGDQQSPDSLPDNPTNASDADCECSFEMQSNEMNMSTMPQRQLGFISLSKLHVNSRELATVSPPPRNMCS